MPQIIASAYEVLQKLGEGGVGEVYLGRHIRLEKDIVIKADKHPVGASTERLRQEVDTLKKLSHTYIPQVYDFVREGDMAYTVMDYIQGESLDKPLKRGERLEQKRVVEWACQLLDALSYLHAHGILHSDIKPANIMLTPQGDIRLIDFNIALSLGDDGTACVGCTRGYASPEYYGQSFGESSRTQTQTARRGTTTRQTSSSRRVFSTSTPDGRMILLDARSDIYALGATLYHLLTGQIPAKHAADVVPIANFPDRNISPALAAIIQKAMAPNPDDRYQSADEMLTALHRLHRDDPRARRHRRRVTAAAVCSIVLLLAGGVLTYIGLHQMERAKNAYALAADSAQALRDGRVSDAVRLAMEALPERGPLDPPDSPDAQRALANALGVYDLSAGYKPHDALSLPATPVNAGLSPDGRYAIALSDHTFFLFDTDTGRQIDTLPAYPSPLSGFGFAFRDPDTMLYAGADGLSAYSLTEHRVLWSAGRPATGVALSADTAIAATVHKDDPEAIIYDAYSGNVLQTVSFQGKRQRVAANDAFSRSDGVLFALDAAGNWLAASFDDGSLDLFGLQSGDLLNLLPASDYVVFEGGFIRGLFAYAANRNDGSSRLEIVDMNAWDSMVSEQTIPTHARIDGAGVCLSQATSLVRLDPETFEQTQLAYTMSDIVNYVRAGNLTLVQTYTGGCALFDENALQIADFTRDASIDFAAVAGDYVLFASRDTPSVQLFRSERRSDAHLFSYDSAYSHVQARVLADYSSAMLSSPFGFQIIRPDGYVRRTDELPDAEQTYQQNYIRDGAAEYLESVYNDGTIRRYDAATGELLSTESGPVPDSSMYQLFETDDYRIEFPFRETPEMRRRSDGKLIAKLELDGLVSEVTQLDDKLIIQYVSTNFETRSAVLVDADGQILADLPNLCDIMPDRTLIFDDGLGNLRRGKLYALAELRALAENYQEARQ